VPSLGPWEILIIAGVIILLFGARKMPQMARSLGQSMRILKAETKGMKSEESQDEPESAKAQQQLPEAKPQAQTPQVAPPIEQTQANKNLK
jgi:sec-independent protein translocase protein TatA